MPTIQVAIIYDNSEEVVKMYCVNVYESTPNCVRMNTGIA